jgi:tetratricopeptide (TPR) repeat protein
MKKIFLPLVLSLLVTAPVWGEAPAVPLLEGMGSHHHAITTNSDLTQRYFDQGLALVYSFNHPEAIRSFQEAARHDPNCAMCWWGVALALGPNINAPMADEAVPEAYAALTKAQNLAGQASEREQAYIRALATRYSPEPVADRGALDRAYADAMRDLARRYPDDLDAATLFAEAVMDTMPWDYWTADGKPRPGTEELVATLEKVLARKPDHLGANHYYIHAVEASPDPDRGLASAERLGRLAPGAGHIVHMPAHIYLRTGRYDQAVTVNRQAVAVDEAYIEQTGAHNFYTMMYYPHNYHFLWYAAAMVGRSAEAIAAAHRLPEVMPAEMVRQEPAMEVFYPVPLFALARFGRWDEILTAPQPPADFPYATAIWHYARGMALAAQGKPAEAAAEAENLERIAGSEPIRALEVPAFYAASQLEIATKVLQGEIAAAEGRGDDRIRLLREAVDAQDKLPYMEPPYWYYPVRQSLGAALLQAKRPAEAETVYRQDLAQNKGNGWSLFGLMQSLRAQGRRDEAQRVEQDFVHAWRDADVELHASAF